jgi:hypothetical protein
MPDRIEPLAMRPATPSRAGTPTLVTGVAARLQGPGGYYNLGNLTGLITGIAQVVTSRGTVPGGAGTVVVGLRDHFLGSPAATALSVAMVIFFISGEVYHHAWRGAGGPNPARVRLGDLLSTFGALALAVSLVLVGNVLLAVTSTVLLAGGKLGSALMPQASWILRVPGLPAFDPFRIAVLASRLPAFLAIGVALLSPLISGAPASTAVVTQQVTLLVCYGLWTRADLLLFRA